MELRKVPGRTGRSRHCEVWSQDKAGRCVARIGGRDGAGTKMKTVLLSDDISCGGCTATIEKSLSAVAGIDSVVGNPEQKSVTIEYNESLITLQAIISKLDELGFESRVVA